MINSYVSYCQYLCNQICPIVLGFGPKEFKRGIGSPFDPCVTTMGQQPYCLSRMEVSDCTFRFGTIIRCDLRTLSLPRESTCDNQYACVIWSPCRKGNSLLTKLFGGLSYEKCGGTITHLHMRRQDGHHHRFPPLNFLVWTRK